MSERTGEEIVIVAAARTPQGRLGGGLAGVPATALGATALGGALEHGGVPASAVDAVIAGHVLQAGAGQNPARQAAIGAGIGWDAPATTVNKVCLSGLTAVIDAARLVRTGERAAVAALGMESMSQAPHLLPGSRSGWRYGSVEVLDHAAHDGLTDAFDQESMGASTEKGNALLGLSRDAQDEVAALSHARATAARAAGTFADELVPVAVPTRGGPVEVAEDEGIRPDTTTESLARLRPAFSPDGTITAGNASQISDGAAAVVVTTRAEAERHGWTVLARIGAAGQVAGPDNSLHAQPAHAVERACALEGISPDDLDLIEINEAFASVVVHSAERLGVGMDRVNIHGGGISLGHPIGASGARLVVHAAWELFRRGSGAAAVALCGGGGQGEALLLHA